MDVEAGEQENDSMTDQMNFKGKLDLPSIGDVFESCKCQCGLRELSILVYMVLRHFDNTWRDIDVLLHNIGGNQCKIALKWAETFLIGDFDAFEDDRRGDNHSDGFYDLFPELEIEAKAFVIESCSEKSAAFSAVDLAKYLDKRFYELIQTSKINDTLVRSSESCRLDFRRWDANFQPSSQRSYFEGHQPHDSVKHRQEFVYYFLSRKDRYHSISEGEQSMWT